MSGDRQQSDPGAEREVLRLCDRYIDEVVLRFGLCPWAEPALRGGRVGRAVCWAAAPEPADCLRFFDQFSAASGRSPTLDIGLLLFPRHVAGWVAFDSFAERVRRADRQRHTAPGAAVEFLVAAFHPDGADAFEGPAQLVSFLRRTPDPMLQLVRAEIIDRVKQTQASASDAVAQRNHDALAGEIADPAHLEALRQTIRAIRADRNETYARLGLGLG